MATLLCALVVSVLLVLTKQHHGHLTMDSGVGIQKFHIHPTPRVGGVGIYLGATLAWAVVPDAVVKGILGAILLAGIPALAFGLLEDVTKRVGVLPRLLATMASGVLAWMLTGIALNRLNVDGLDSIMALTPVAVVFTAFAVGGVANAINIMDGFHGLASGTSIIALLAISAIAGTVGDTALVLACLLIAASIVGFWLVNYPWGKLFMGDGGAYFVGFALAWLAVLLPMRNPGVSVWASLLICAYPIIEVLYSVVRRYVSQQSPGAADSAHLHSLIKTRFIRQKLAKMNKGVQLAAVSPIVCTFALVPASAAVALFDRTEWLVSVLVLCLMLYHIVYRYLATREVIGQFIKEDGQRSIARYPMRIALIADVFPPHRCSGAIQIRDLAFELVKQGYEPTVLIPDSNIDAAWRVEEQNGVRVVRLRAPSCKDIGYIQRTLRECWMPFSMLRNLRKSPLAQEKWDGVIWYSPTIFLGPIARALKKASSCPSYLILRDIFPEWAVDMGLMGRSFPYRFFKMVEKYQYSVADVIGVQSPANKEYLLDWSRGQNRRVEVLHNWLAKSPDTACSISVQNTCLSGRKIFVYAGNMGVAQGVDVLLNLAESMQERPDLGFMFVGRGSDVQRLRSDALARRLTNVSFHDEVPPSEIAGLYAQCHVGLVCLDPRHRTHNIPGKFVSYMQGGLPVLASINPGNDMIGLIEDHQLGRVVTDASVASLKKLAIELVEQIEHDHGMQGRCTATAATLFSPTEAVKQILESLQPQWGSNAVKGPERAEWPAGSFGYQSTATRL